jgi:hypothetical protein
VEPGNRQAQELEVVIKKKMEKEGLIGMAVVGGAALAFGGLVGLGIALAKSSKNWCSQSWVSFMAPWHLAQRHSSVVMLNAKIVSVLAPLTKQEQDVTRELKRESSSLFERFLNEFETFYRCFFKRSGARIWKKNEFLKWSNAVMLRLFCPCISAGSFCMF